MAEILLGYKSSHLMFVEKVSKTNPTKAESKNNLRTTAFPLVLHHAEKPVSL